MERRDKNRTDNRTPGEGKIFGPRLLLLSRRRRDNEIVLPPPPPRLAALKSNFTFASARARPFE